MDPTTTILRASEQQTRNYRAAAASEVFLCDAIAITHPIATATLAAFDAGLRNEQTGHGYRRNDDGGEYDLRVWVSVDLWMAQLRYRRNETIVARGAVRPVMPEQDGKAITSTAATGCGCGSSGTSNVGMMLGVVLLLMCVKHRGACDRHHRR